MKDNKGFTLVELLGVIVILAILLTFASFTYTKYLVQSKNRSFELAINTFEDTVAASLEDCASGRISNFCSTYSIPAINDTIRISLTDLVNNYYIEPIKNPYDAKTTCDGYIDVTRKEVVVSHNGRSFGADDSNIDLEYKTCLICGEKSSDGC